jgi:hypothetical protein
VVGQPDLGPTSQDWVGALATPETYQAAVRRLTAELRQVKSDQAEERSRCRDELRSLRAQLAEGLTPEILRLRKGVREWRLRAQAAEARLREAHRGGHHDAR